MKVCSKCGNTYTDDTLLFCLSDGTNLKKASTEQKTEVYSVPTLSIPQNNNQENETQISNRITNEKQFSETQVIKQKGVSPIWVLSTFGLLGIILALGILYWLISNNFFKHSQARNDSAIITNTNQKENSNSSNQTSPTPTPKQTPKEKLYRVVGVKSNDVLYIRPSAGNLKSIVGKIPPNGKGIKIIGRSKRVGKSRWVLINYQDKRGWVNNKFITVQK